VNNKKTAEYTDTRAGRPEKGHIALQMMTANRVWYRNIEIQEGAQAIPSGGYVPSDEVKRAVAWVLDLRGTVEVGPPKSRMKITSADDITKPVTCVDIQDLTLTDADIDRLRALPDLERLGLKETAITDAGLKSLTEMPFAPNLSYLYLAGPQKDLKLT